MVHYTKEVGLRIKALRQKNKMTQLQLAEKLCYTSERQLQRIENGEAVCPTDRLVELADILNTSTDYLLFGRYINRKRVIMEKIVTRGLKIDLHIHSEYSRNKDGDKVKNNTLANLRVLINKLNENEIEMCSITDHDCFNYDMYSTLKQQEGKGSIKKVLPGVEFSVEFADDKVIHIVTIFNDQDDDKVKKIQSVFETGNGKKLYKNGFYTREAYYNVLKEINLDFVMIAHQKKSPNSPQKPHKSDAKYLGEEAFNELIMLEYFDAFEFRDKNNEIHNKLYAQARNFEDKLRFITGTDCHDWPSYPYYGPGKNGDMNFTYLKSLPTFKGLAMAITDVNRINFTDSFFGQGKYLESLEFEIDGKEVIIPLSRGINVIIGDNSVGKSLLLHELTDNRQLAGNAKSNVRKGYQKYLEKNNIRINTIIDVEDIFKFNYQGSVREIFDNPNLKADDYLKEYAPLDIDVERYRRPVMRELERLYKGIQRKFDYDKKINNLQRFNILENEPDEKELVFEGKVDKENYENLKLLIKAFEEVSEKIKAEILSNPELIQQDVSHLENELAFLDTMAIRYSNILKEREQENRKINIYSTYIKEYKEGYKSRQTSESNEYQAYVENIKASISDIVELVSANQKIDDFKFDLTEMNVIPEQNHVDKYVFVSKINVEKIDNAYMEGLVDSVLRQGHKIDLPNLTEEGLRASISRFPNDVEDSLEGLKQKLAARVQADFQIVQNITENGKDVFTKLSQGFDARMYFRLLAGEERNKGIYIVDQPEDHISPLAIKNEVIDQFRSMSRKRQVIMVTHNPQFIVNLDVDNVIFLSKNEEHFMVQSGALEYADSEYGILDLVAKNIDGGLDTIKKRMKRYDKEI